MPLGCLALLLLFLLAQNTARTLPLKGTTPPAADQMRTLLTRLSGRLMKRHRPYTAPALLAGVWTLLAMLAVLEEYSIPALRRLAAHALPVWQDPTGG